MRKRNIHQSIHQFDACPFEAFYKGSWKIVECLRIRMGAITALLADGGDTFEENVPLSNIRMRSRKAKLSDCTCFIRPGLDICVLSSSQLTESSSEEKNSEPVWLDAKIISIERRPHEPECSCQFFVSFYLTQGPLCVARKTLAKDTIIVQIDQISILQKLKRDACVTEHYRWNFSEDCSSLERYKLFTGKFSSDLSWLLVASVLKQIEFEVRSIGNKIVYQIIDDDYNENSLKLEGHATAVNFKLENGISIPIIVPFAPTDILEKETAFDVHEDESSSFYDPMGLRRSKRRNIQPERYLGCDLSELDIDDAPRMGTCRTYRWEYKEMPLALSIQADHAYYLDDHSIQADRGYFLDDHSIQADHAYYLDDHSMGDERVRSYKKGSCRNFFGGQSKSKARVLKSIVSTQREDLPKLDSPRKHQCELAIVPVPDETDQMIYQEDPLDAPFPGNFSGEMNEVFSKYVCINGTSAQTRRSVYDIDLGEAESGWKGGWTGGWKGRNSRKRSRGKRDYFISSGRESFRYAGTNARKSFSASMYREMIRKCMESIKSTMHKEQPPVIDQWNEIQSGKSKNQKNTSEIPSTIEEDDAEIEMLWKEMELCMASTYFQDSEESNVELPTNVVQTTSEQCGHVCRHEYRLNEEIGILCRLCGFVSTEIKDVVPTFLHCAGSNPYKGTQNEEDSGHKPDEGSGLDLFSIPAPSSTPLSEGEGTVWTLIPDLKWKLRLHQMRAFEFLWRNIAGSVVPTVIESMVKKRGGCVISHSPGAGKTLLIIAFLVSYLKLFPGSRPLVLAPKTTLYTWYKEIIKWEVPIPVYQIHGGSTYRGEVLRRKLRVSPGDPKPNQDFMHVLDCMEKIQKWLAHPSVLLMGYTSFLTLTREDSKFAHRQYMAQVLRQCPGILILDEGHNPRSTKSRLRKALMKVETGLRVLLSGTLFQNNFGEYFNTLTLARPTFVTEVLRELDPKFKRGKKAAKTRFSLENRARKFFIDKIGMKINSSVTEERMNGLVTLKNLTSEFIDVHEGGSYDNLPGLQCYTLMMKSTPYQQELLVKLQNQRPIYKGFPLELELLITLGSIHPWLIRTTACATQYFSVEELEGLEKYKFNLKFGSKVRFVMSLVPRCLIRKEKVLIFCHNIAPINLFVEIFELFYGWRKGEEVLVLQGDVELFERGRVIDKFEEPGGPSKVMLASISACAEGISLTAASRVILLDSEWNPSRSKQAIARAFRPGQAKVVYVYQLLAAGTLEEEKHGRTTWKEWVSSMIFSEELVEDPSQRQAEKIEDDILREIVEEDRAPLFHMIMKNEKASNLMVRGKD
ncbi:SNF2 domain-containing protein CLASSY 1-like [Diospyros lotus]|uniref:SNF2 domain-containing protein CLASSY 1-like n=1 Tax=Diospyros lotus TaxID=55363 RepID=UPI00225450B9|nr:SNF2 domain-containing protein CLASSY 1-like [Diospyros lotus]XP_052187133.1 SNF2 domain-containing protein CLASSY 1-like [Diospyros lotus]XP_052187134.1 SNF2 domain-containing protein CLASSY 1-like [Diospyros lotus]XP_052187135.1 SNF2 domain-containing protein CLASSY 1-like [Diospyros lotus]XP_052187136.1 SNF2 domain-containing protein CLASSY 1-like [Diospyros lotus]XP_052187137.1 SNF2 domain-containing protein CLASSY 1-like [Diospyros lotus]XP_052187138.1 SNF2 domain-containing protein C